MWSVSFEIVHLCISLTVNLEKKVNETCNGMIKYL